MDVIAVLGCCWFTHNHRCEKEEEEEEINPENVINCSIVFIVAPVVDEDWFWLASSMVECIRDIQVSSRSDDNDNTRPKGSMYTLERHEWR